MTVSSTLVKTTFSGNSSATVFPSAGIVVTAETDVLIWKISGGIVTFLTLNSDYSVAPVGGVYPATVNVTYPLSGSPLATGDSLLFGRLLPLTQNTLLANQGPYFPKTIEQEFDRLAMQDQQLDERSKRGLQLPITDIAYAGNGLLPNAADRASQYIFFDAAGNPTVKSGAPYTPVGSNLTAITAFGCVGDNATDNTVTFQAAVNTGLPLFVPAGTYICDNITLPSNITIVGAGKFLSIFKRKASSVQTTWFSATSKAAITLRDLGFDGNNANETIAADNLKFTGCLAIHVAEIYSHHAEGASGIFFDGGTDGAGNDHSSVKSSVFHANNSRGIRVQNSWSFLISGNRCSSNASVGIEVNDLNLPVPDNVQNYFSIADNLCFGNFHGIAVSGLNVGSSASVPLFQLNFQTNFVSITGNKCHNNSVYGIYYAGHAGSVIGNACNANGTVSGGAGFNFGGALGSVIQGNTTYDNYNYGYDCGASNDCIFSGNISRFDGMTQNTAAVGFNMGATQNNVICDNVVTMTGSYDCSGFILHGLDGASLTSNFTTHGDGMVCMGNRVTMNTGTNSIGFWVNESSQAMLKNNMVFAETNGRAFAIVSTAVTQSGNISLTAFSSGTQSVAVASASIMVIPDVGEQFVVSGTTTITNIRTTQQQTYVDKIRDVRMGLVGSGYTPGSSPAATFSGGGGTGAAGVGRVTNQGTIVGVKFSSNGSGYTSAGTVAFAAPPSGVTATGTPQFGCDNQEGRIITLLFLGACTVTDGGNLGLNGDFVTSAGRSILVLRGAFGSWLEVSRCTS